MDNELYEHLSNVTNLSQESIRRLKLYYKEEVNSNRQLDAIKSVKDLLNLLSKRKAINQSMLEDIAMKIDTDLNVIRREHHGQINTMKHEELVRSCEFQSTLDGIYVIISNEIGQKKWREFARKLNITEANIDRLSSGENLKESITRVLHTHQRAAYPDCWRPELLEALQAAGRMDLRKMVEKKLDYYRILVPTNTRYKQT